MYLAYFRKLTLAAALVTSASPLYAQCPAFPARGVQIIDALYDDTLARGTDDQRRTLTKMFIEQLVFDFPLDGWVWKSADPGRPPSKDSLTRMVNGRLCNWDWQNGSTRQRAVQAGQLGEDITGQTPIAVQGVNRMVTAPVPATPAGPTTPEPPSLPAMVLTPEMIRAIVHDEVDRVYAQSERIFAADNTLAQANLAAIMGRFDTLDNKVDHPGWFMQVMSNRYVQLGLAGLGTFIGQRLLSNPAPTPAAAP